MRKLLLAGLIVILIILLPLLGGSMIYYLDGATNLDIDGVAEKVGRPASTISLDDSWEHYGGDAGAHRYNTATAIDPTNVANLKKAWEYRSGDLLDKQEAMREAASEGTPILIDDSLIFCTPFNEVIALDPGTGEERWRFDPEISLEQRPANQFVCRGVSHWRGDDGDDGDNDCASRIFMGTNDARLIAIDARNGRRCSDFGENGEVRIDPGMELWWPGEFQITSPPAIVGDTVIVGSAISDNARVVAPAGSVRAFDARTGDALWDWDPIPRSGSEHAREEWQGVSPPNEGHANVWAPMSVDTERGLVFLPTTSPSPDFYGGLRPGDNRHANSVVALDAASGEVVWGFQTIHHDVWDYDVPAQPGLYSVWKDGEAHEVVVQVNKTGFVFVLDRETGEPFLPIEEREVPQGGVDGETLSPTQPYPVATPALVPSTVSPDDAFGITWFDKQGCRKRIEASSRDGLFTPPSLQGTILLPFTGGGANWGGPAYDPERNLLIVNMSNMAHHVQLFPADEFDGMRAAYPDQEVSPQEGAPYGMKREPMLSALGLPCTPPPWGILAAVDLEDGDVVWRKTLGTTDDLSPGPGLKLGTPSLGGPIVTAGGLVFIGATMDHYLRAFDASNGTELWRGRLPAPAIATPMTYTWNGRQYVVIFAGGNARMGTALADSLIAFALPDD